MTTEVREQLLVDLAWYDELCARAAANGWDLPRLPSISPTAVLRLIDTYVWQEVDDELAQAVIKHASIRSPHEGWAVILEELDELWAEVKANRGRQKSARHEATQIAAMAIRYIIDLNPGRLPNG